jgi:hypothetical protein
MARISESCHSVLFVVLAISNWPSLHFYFMYVSIQALNAATRVFRPLVAQSVDIRKQLKSARLSPIEYDYNATYPWCSC